MLQAIISCVGWTKTQAKRYSINVESITNRTKAHLHKGLNAYSGILKTQEQEGLKRQISLWMDLICLPSQWGFPENKTM